MRSSDCNQYFGDWLDGAEDQLKRDKEALVLRRKDPEFLRQISHWYDSGFPTKPEAKD